MQAEYLAFDPKTFDVRMMKGTEAIEGYYLLYGVDTLRSAFKRPMLEYFYVELQKLHKAANIREEWADLILCQHLMGLMQNIVDKKARKKEKKEEKEAKKYPKRLEHNWRGAGRKIKWTDLKGKPEYKKQRSVRMTDTAYKFWQDDGNDFFEKLSRESK